MFANDSIRHVYLAMFCVFFFTTAYVILLIFTGLDNEPLKGFASASVGSFLTLLTRPPQTQTTIQNSEKTTIEGEEKTDGK
jgi:hypothetical protein